MNKNLGNFKSSKGFSIIELMITLTIGLVLFAGVLGIFVGMRSTTGQTSSFGEMQENGRFAISVLTNDLLKQNFFGDYAGTFGSGGINFGLAPPANECVGGGVNNGSFPNGVGPFRTLWGQTVTNANPMGCFNDAKAGSDLIQFKRVVASPLQVLAGVPPVPVPVNVTTTDNYFLVSNPTVATIFPRGNVPAIDNSRVWEYQHHIYYVSEESQVGSTEVVPVLMQGQLTDRMTFAPIIDGIEMIRFMYGVDTDTDPTLPGYGIIDAFISADGAGNPNLAMTEAFWDNAGGARILAVKVYVLARSIRLDRQYENNNTYQLGDLAVTFNDNYRRLLFSSTVNLYNADVDSW